MHPGKISSTFDIEDDLISFIEYNRGLGNAITTYALIVKLI
jgi:hypothetical protein